MVGGDPRWREDDVEAFDDYLRARREYEDNGGDPNSPDGPSPPVYSTGCEVFDAREATARSAERERRQRCKTLAAGNKPIAAESPVELPDVATKTTEHTADN